MANAGEIVRFWRDAGPKAWFAKTETFDGRCRAFEADPHAAARREARSAACSYTSMNWRAERFQEKSWRIPRTINARQRAASAYACRARRTASSIALAS